MIVLPVTATAETTDLVAGRNMTIGTVTATPDGGDLVVTYTVTEPGWCIGLTHLYVGATPPEKGAPGRFPYQGDAGCSQSFEYRVPLTSFAPYVAAHAEVEQIGGKGETAWGTGTERLRGGWGTYFRVIVSVPE
jgi:hypothetical protein